MAFGKARDKELLSAKREVAAILFLAFPAATGRGGTRPSLAKTLRRAAVRDDPVPGPAPAFHLRNPQDTAQLRGLQSVRLHSGHHPAHPGQELPARPVLRLVQRKRLTSPIFRLLPRSLILAA